MELFELGLSHGKDEADFIKNVCQRFSVTPSDIHIKLTTDCSAEHFDSPLCRGIKSLFRYDCLCGPPTSPSQHSNHYLFTKLFAHLIAGPKGIDELTCALKNYDYSDRCSLVWIGDYFAYRCRTCGLTPSMSLCGTCFNAGNHENHDFNKFKSTCGGACDCGDPSVIKPSGNCRFHGPDKVANRPCPPRELIATLQFLLPSVMKALMFWFWDQCKVEEPSLNESEAPMLYFLHRLHACGWVTQQLMVDVMIDSGIFSDLVKDCCCTPAYRSYRASLASRPQLYSSESDVNLASTELKHATLLESFLYTIVKLRFPESLCTLLIGLLPISDFKKMFIDAYVDHYEAIASTLMITSRVRNISPEVAMQLNNRIVHISVQLFSGVNHAFRMVMEKKLHYLIVKWMKNMLMMSRTRLDDRGKMVVNCDGVLIQNNAFWPLTSDLSNIISHKIVADVLVEDKEFLVLWTDILKLMQFMNCFSMKEGSHIEYETMACYHGLTMEIEVSISIMWYIWDHYRASPEKEHCLMYTRACIESLAHHLSYLGRLVSSSTQWAHPVRGPLSLHLPLSRHAACFLSLSVFTHHVKLKSLMEPFLHPNPNVLRRLMEELANVLLGCQEVLIGYWIRNGQSVRQLVMHYMHSQMCYSMIDLDIFLFQVCATLMHPVYILNSLVDQSRLLQNFCFHRELMALTRPAAAGMIVDRQPMAIEAWLTNLCWILDLRNNLGLSETGLIEKELICFLAHGTRKRSDLSYLLPDRCLPQNTDAIDECLQRVATYVAPSCDSMSGSLLSGHYSLKSELWDEEFDPVFYALRMVSKKEQAAAVQRYRPHCSQRTGIRNTSSFWPPYRLPPDLSSDFVDLENALHSRHLHYLLFSLLSLYVYGDPLVPEESLTIVIHLLYRAVVAGGLLLKEGRKPDRLPVEVEPAMPRFDPIQCTEAMMAATNREAELEAMQFVDADSEGEGEIEDDDDDDDDIVGEEVVDDVDESSKPPHAVATAPETSVSGSSIQESMEVDEPVIVPSSASGSLRSASAAQGLTLRRTNAFRVRRPTNIPLKWDLSIVACPYPMPTSAPTIFQNLPTWLATTSQTVSAAEMETKTFAGSSKEYVAPKREESCTMVDSILSLLVKAHARLYLSRVATSKDPQAQQGAAPASAAVQDCAFLTLPTLTPNDDDKNTTSVDLTARCMAVLNATGLEESSDGSHKLSPLARALQADTSSGTPEEKMVKVLTEMPPELRYFAVCPPAYKLPSAGKGQPPENSSQTLDSPSELKSVDCGDGVFWIGRLLDKIVELSPHCEKELNVYLERASDPFDMAQEMESTNTEEADSSLLPSNLQSNAKTRAQRKRAASERRKRLMDMMASKQRAFADNFLKDLDMDKIYDEANDDVVSKVEYEYNCVICQAKPEIPQPMVLLVMLCESGVMQDMRNYSNIPRLSGERMTYSRSYLCEDTCTPKPLPIVPPELRRQSDLNLKPRPTPYSGEARTCKSPQPPATSAPPATSLLNTQPCRISDTIIIPSTNLSSTPSCEPARGDVLNPVAYVEKRQWWNLALPNEIAFALPLLRSGVLLQTCGHAVHRECFQRYRMQSMHQGGAGVTRWMASCPLCRRDVHFLLPLYDPEHPRSPPPPHGVIINEEHAKPVSIALTSAVEPSASREHTAGTNPGETSPSTTWHAKLFTQTLRKKLVGLPTESHSFWSNLVGGIEEDPQHRYRLVAGLFSGVSEVAVLLRSQFESELSILMAYPDLYRSVARRCLFREMMNYLRYVYSSPSDLLTLADSLSRGCPLKTSLISVSSLNVPLTYAIFNDPADVLMTFLPHVWPDEEHFMALGSVCICLAYARALVGLILGQMPEGTPGTFVHCQRTSIQCAQARMKDIPTPLKSNILAMILALEQLFERTPVMDGDQAVHQLQTTVSMGSSVSMSTNSITPSSTYLTASSSGVAALPMNLAPSARCEDRPSHLEAAASLDVVQLTLDPQEAGRQLQDHLISRILPTVRLFALCLARWRDSHKLREDDLSHPILALSLPFVGIVSNSAKRDLEKGHFVKEFLALASFLGIGCSSPELSVEQDDPMLGVGPLLPFVQAVALRSGLTTSRDGARALDEILVRWIGQLTFAIALDGKMVEPTDQSPTVADGSSSQQPALAMPLPTPSPRAVLRGMQPFLPRTLRTSQLPVAPIIGASAPKRVASLSDWVKNLGPLMTIGRQLFPPRLIRPPEAFDDLFNNLQVVSCATAKHPFQNNVLCLICGQLLCGICFASLPQLLFRHAYKCDGVVGVALEINTSLVHVSLGMSSCEWGSIYLDSYGEEDLELKRGKPLFLNEDRFALLESQWMSHSFRHVLKHWRHL